MFARIRIPAGSAEQLRIASSYIEQIGQLDRVWVKENNQAVRRFVRTGLTQNGDTLIIAGLNEGDQLILPNDLPKP
jgi:membrane fusion protein (multidrug efflux system)